MEARTREVVIPERKITITEFVANDGKEFASEGECIRYERLAEERKFEAATHMTELEIPKMGYWYFAGNEEQLAWIKKNLRINEKGVWVKEYGKIRVGEWIAVQEDHFSFEDEVRVWSLTEYKKEVAKEVKRLNTIANNLT